MKAVGILSGVKGYQDLAVWNTALEVAEMVYQVSARSPASEKFGMKGQVRRGSKEFLHFLEMASGSLAEMETILILAQRLGMASRDQGTPLLAYAAEIGRMLSGLKRSINSRTLPRPTGHCLLTSL